MEKLSITFYICSTLFLLYMSFRWSTETNKDVFVKMATFLLSIMGLVLIFETFK